VDQGPSGAGNGCLRHLLQLLRREAEVAVDVDSVVRDAVPRGDRAIGGVGRVPQSQHGRRRQCARQQRPGQGGYFLPASGHACDPVLPEFVMEIVLLATFPPAPTELLQTVVAEGPEACSGQKKVKTAHIPPATTTTPPPIHWRIARFLAFLRKSQID